MNQKIYEHDTKISPAIRYCQLYMLSQKCGGNMLLSNYQGGIIEVKLEKL